MMKLNNQSQQGFTIIELLIATSVLTLILLLATVMITSIGNLYYKGITLSQTQDTARSVVDQLTQDLQLSDGKPSVPDPTVPGNPNINTTLVPGQKLYATCIGTTRYSYVLNQQIVTSLPHVLWRDTIGSGVTCSPVKLSTTFAPNSVISPGTAGTELMGAKSRLTSLVIKVPLSGSTLYTIKLSIAYGEDDLLAGANTSNLLAGSDYNVGCAGSTGNQFCATDRLTTSVIQRVNKG
jgi:prepilin-type N-terminal cleavage/methylation domain-containing protein